MKRRAFSWIAALATTGGIWFCIPTAGKAQAPTAGELTAKAGNANSVANLNPLPAAPRGATPRLADGRVDFSGVWRPADVFLIEDISLGLKKGETLPLSAAGQRNLKTRLSKDDPEANCLPTGVPRLAPYPWRIVETATHMFFLFEGNIHSYRQIFMDGRKHPEDPDPTWYGHSVARWDGDTLVVDSVGLNDRFWFDFAGHRHTEKLHVIERYRRPDFDHLDYDTTIDDPGTFTKTFAMHGHS